MLSYPRPLFVPAHSSVLYPSLLPYFRFPAAKWFLVNPARGEERYELPQPVWPEPRFQTLFAAFLDQNLHIPAPFAPTGPENLAVR